MRDLAETIITTVVAIGALILVCSLFGDLLVGVINASFELVSGAIVLGQ